MNDDNLAAFYHKHQGKLSDKWSIYLNEYERIFSPYRSKSINLLEIGVQNGGSLEIWAKYFPNATNLIGCDINPDCAKLVYKDARISILVGDANTNPIEELVVNHSHKFDIIIDDGSHLSSDIIKSFIRYFPSLGDGGVFVVEDLHCSYWKEFEGGLYDPYSSVNFFKRLADTINYEHWGTDKNRTAILKGFCNKFNIQLTEKILQHIHSIEFVNSMCIIRKETPEANTLGQRFVAGNIEDVVTGHLKHNGIHHIPPTQTGNFWSECNSPPDENFVALTQRIQKRDSQLIERDKELAERDEQLAERDEQLAQHNKQLGELHRNLNELLNSTSWRITKPFRFVSHQLRRFQYIATQIKPAIKRGGGLRSTLLKATWLFRKEGLAGIKRGFRLVAMDHSNSNDYTKWVHLYDHITDDTRSYMRAYLDEFKLKPLISIIMPTYNPKPEWLIEAIESVRQQIYPRWELCIADDASTDKSIAPILRRYVNEDSRIKVVFREKNGHISAASNSALELTTGEWVALLDHDDLLSEHALFWLVSTINCNPSARLIYSDEDKINEVGERQGPYFKCDWNPDLFYSHNLFSHLGAYQRKLLLKVGGFRIGLEGAQDYDLALRCIEQVDTNQIHHIPRILYHWRAHSESTAQTSEAKPYAMLTGERALNEHFKRTGITARAELVSHGHGYRVHYPLPDSVPLVSLIIPTYNGLALIRQCIESIVEKTSYPNYEILIIDNGSDDPEILDYFKSISSEPRIKIHRDDRPFNYSQLNNSAVEIVKGDLIGLINNDIEVISPEWLSEMVSHALRPEIGAVGAKLLYPNNTLQHGGVVLGLGGLAAHSHRNFPKESFGYLGRLSLISGFSAVTAACLLIQKSIYNQVGGLNENDLKIAYNDVDFCLRVREAGYQNIWTPYAELYHHESATRGYEDTSEKQARLSKEAAYMIKRWGKILSADPAYSPNLTLDYEDFSYAWPPRVKQLPDDLTCGKKIN